MSRYTVNMIRGGNSEDISIIGVNKTRTEKTGIVLATWTCSALTKLKDHKIFFFNLTFDLWYWHQGCYLSLCNKTTFFKWTKTLIECKILGLPAAEHGVHSAQRNKTGQGSVSGHQRFPWGSPQLFCPVLFPLCPSHRLPHNGVQAYHHHPSQSEL